MTPAHKNCSYILPRQTKSFSQEKMRRERTHACWCSAWRMVEGQYLIWRDGDWRMPMKGELQWPKNSAAFFNGN